MELLEDIRRLLKHLGENPDREALAKTPKRYLTALEHLTQGYRQSVQEVVNGAIYEIAEASSSEMVIVRDIELYSLCEHHLLPFFGKCHVAYLPDQEIVGLSKIPRLVDACARRLQVQERLTTQIAEAITEHLKPRGAACVMEAYHLCMMMRGVQKQNTVAVTSAMLGVFRTSEKTRAEFLTLIHSRSL